jgi:hypothetical protein
MHTGHLWVATMKKRILIFVLTTLFLACHSQQDELIEEYRSVSYDLSYTNDYRSRINKDIIHRQPIDSLRLRTFNDSMDVVQKHIQQRLDSLYNAIHH